MNRTTKWLAVAAALVLAWLFREQLVGLAQSWPLLIALLAWRFPDETKLLLRRLASARWKTPYGEVDEFDSAKEQREQELRSYEQARLSGEAESELAATVEEAER